jgi:hypothetical protein
MYDAMPDYTYVDEDVANQNNYRSFAVAFGIGVVSLAACGVLIYKACRFSYAFLTQDDSRYAFIAKISPVIRGKNLHTQLVFSRSNSGNQAKKIWFNKPIFFNSLGHNYDLKAAATEAFFGSLIVALLGKELAAKTKFNLYDAGVVSRIPGDDLTKVIDLFTFCMQKRVLPPQVQQHFMKVIILGVILGNRDMRLENLVVKLDHNNNPSFVYGIDHELGGSEPFEMFRPLVDVLYRISNNPKQIINLLMDKDYKWNYAANRKNFDKSVFDYYGGTLLGSITPQQCVAVMDTLSQQIAVDEFRICLAVRDKILAKLARHEYVYSGSSINSIIVPTIDDAIARVVENVKITRQFLEKIQTRRSRFIELCHLKSQFNI